MNSIPIQIAQLLLNIVCILILNSCRLMQPPDCPGEEDKFEVDPDEWVAENGVGISCPPGSTDILCGESWCTVDESGVYCVDTERLLEWTDEHGYVLRSDESEYPYDIRCDPTPED